MTDISVQRRLRIAAERPTNPDAHVCLEAARQITDLQAALREALKDWEAVSAAYNSPRGPDERIAELRAQFLDDK